MTTTTNVQPILQGPEPDPQELYANFKPVRYRYVMAYLHDQVVDGVLHKAGEVMYVLSMTSVTYSVGMYSGTEMSGNIYLPEFYLQQMAHPPLNNYERWTHPDQSGIPVGASFECGNRAIYIMRNEEVVWGGILWTRSYSSGSKTMTITALSWDGYLYYRVLRRSVVFLGKTNVYTIWYAVLRQALSDFTWSGSHDGRVSDATLHPGGDPKKSMVVPWTGLTRSLAPKQPLSFNAPARSTESSTAQAQYESWARNSPHIELPSPTIRWKRGTPPVEVTATVNKTFRGYDLGKVGEMLEQWADTETLASTYSAGSLSRFEYRVVCWFDSDRQVFRQRYVFGEMSYAATSTHNEPVPNGIIRELFGRNTAKSVDADQPLVFDFPGHISAWSLNESMEEAATRVITSDQTEEAGKHVTYANQSDLMLVPSKPPRGGQGWLLYDHVVAYGATQPSTLQRYANSLLQILHVPQAAQINDLAAANRKTGQRVSQRSSDLSITLATDPTTSFPDWGLGDWATFAIEDPFYGGVMYLQRRIIGYSVTIVPEQESDYSHESIELTLTDQTKIDEGS